MPGFIPCGIFLDGGPCTSLSAEAGRDITVAQVLDVSERHLADVLATAASAGRDVEPALVPA